MWYSLRKNCSPRMPNEASQLTHDSSTADHPGKANTFHSTINSFNLMAPAVGPMSMVPVHSFIAL